MGGVGCASSSSRALARLRERGVLRVAMDPSFPPFEYVDEQGQIQGFDADLAHHLARCLDVEAQPVTTNFDGLYDALTVGRADVIISGLYPDPFRTERFVFSEPYFNAGDVLVGRQREGPEGVGDLAGRRVAVVFGTTGHTTALEWQARLSPPPTLLTVETAAEALTALREGEVEVAVVDHLAAQIALREGAALSIMELPESIIPYVVAARRDDAALIEEINRCLEVLRAEGTLEALAEQWFTAVSLP